MKISIENGTVTCSLEDKNSAFLAACAGMFDGFLHGKLKLYDYINSVGTTEYGIIQQNALLLASLIQIAEKYGIEVSDEVKEYNNLLQERSREIDERQRILDEEQERAEIALQQWERLCKHGCGRCKNLKYLIDQPMCKETGEELREGNNPVYVGGVLHLFNLEPFPAENCPFNIKKQGVKNEEFGIIRESPCSTR